MSKENQRPCCRNWQVASSDAGKSVLFRSRKYLFQEIVFECLETLLVCHWGWWVGAGGERWKTELKQLLLQSSEREIQTIRL